MNWKTGVAAAALSAVVVFATGPLATQAFAGSKNVLKSVDTDNDGTVDMDEARVAANALFDQLDGDHDGTLDRKELRGHVSAKELAAADPDHDGTLTKDEYANLVASRFKAADPDSDGTLDAKEIKSVARLLK
jgi:Ca2+-binding EF-hand superfamily protein